MRLKLKDVYEAYIFILYLSKNTLLQIRSPLGASVFLILLQEYNPLSIFSGTLDLKSPFGCHNLSLAMGSQILTAALLCSRIMFPHFLLVSESPGLRCVLVSAACRLTVFNAVRKVKI